MVNILGGGVGGLQTLKTSKLDKSSIKTISIKDLTYRPASTGLIKTGLIITIPPNCFYNCMGLAYHVNDPVKDVALYQVIGGNNSFPLSGSGEGSLASASCYYGDFSGSSGINIELAVRYTKTSGNANAIYLIGWYIQI